MSCGFGAVVLLFLIIKHNVQAYAPAANLQSPNSAEVDLLDRDIRDGRKNLAQLRNTIDQLDRQTVIAEGLARRIQKKAGQTEGSLHGLKAPSEANELAALEARVQGLKKTKEELVKENAKTGQDLRSYKGQGKRQYITGLSMHGDRILILFDDSASMLDSTIVNVLRRRDMVNVQRKTDSAKWHQALATVDWLTARMPPGSNYQIYTFNTQVKSLVAGTKGRWLNASDTTQLNDAVAKLKKTVPNGGTSLIKAFMAAESLDPTPDSIYLITDGLPTQSTMKPPSGAKVSGQQRARLFSQAVRILPRDVQVSTILLPMEGDPLAAYAFWGLAVGTHGAFLSPAKDWP